VRLEPLSLGGRQRLFIIAWPKQSVKAAEMDEEASMPGLELWYPEEEILLLGDRGYVGFIDGIQFRIARPGIEVPVNADCFSNRCDTSGRVSSQSARGASSQPP